MIEGNGAEDELAIRVVLEDGGERASRRKKRRFKRLFGLGGPSCTNLNRPNKNKIKNKRGRLEKSLFSDPVQKKTRPMILFKGVVTWYLIYVILVFSRCTVQTPPSGKILCMCSRVPLW